MLFSEAVTRVNSDDFELSPGSPTSGAITAVTGSGSQYYVTVGSSQAGTYNLDISDDNNIIDSSSNPLSSTTPTGDDQSYVVTATADTTPPALTLVGSPTVSISVGSTYADSGATCIDDTDGDITSQIVTSGSVDTGTAGTYILTFSCTDTASNSATQVSRTVFVVSSAPTVTSITRHNPATQTTDSNTLQFSVLFSEAVTGVSADDFELSPGSPTSAAYTYTSAPSLFVPYDVVKTDTITVTDSGTVTSVSVSVDITHDYIADLKVEIIAPDGTTKVLHNRGGGSSDDIVETYTPDFGSVSINGDWKLRLHDNYDADEGTLNSWSLSFGEGSTPITAVTGSGSQYYVTVGSSQAGTYNLDVSDDNDIVDSSSNSLSSTTPTGGDQSYVVTEADPPPTVTSITRYNPAAQTTDSDTLQFSVLFSEAVTGVSADDFELSPGSPTSAAYTYTSAPSLFVPYDVVKTDTITVTDSGTVTSVSVSVDITHDYIADLKVELVAPDGTTKVLHNRGGGSADDIVETYTPDFGSVSINGNWQLRLHDNYDGDEGTLNSWSLSFGEGSTPITAVTGSGSQYYVTVDSSQTGTYNLDVSDDNDIVDSSSNSLSSTTPTGDDQSYVVTATADTTPPVLTLVGSPTVAISVGSTYTDSGATCIDDTDGDITSQIVTSGSVDTSTAGTYAIVFSCTDAASNSATQVSRTVFVVNSAPTVTSITRYNPAAQTTDSDTLQFSVLFSEAVTGVDSDDFELSPGSPTPASSYTYTSAPSLFVPYDVVKTDTITVTDTGTVTSVSVSVDITHDYIGDLKVELVAPDGTTKVLHNRGGGSSDDIVETYTPDFGSVSINGDWKLRLHDNYDADEGTLNSWSLSLGEGSTPITAVTGSGSQYYVTVDSSQAGTYNLDVSDDNDIVDSSSNSLSSTTPTGDDQSYIVTEAADTTPPVLTLVGPSIVSVSVGSTYTDAGATCIDDTDGDITSQIVTSGSVDTSTADTYAIVFSCTDAADNSAAYVFRIIYVS